MERNFQKGDRVLCVDATFRNRGDISILRAELTLPEEGEVYTVRGVDIGLDGKPGILLEGLKNVRGNIGNRKDYEPCFSEDRFQRADHIQDRP